MAIPTERDRGSYLSHYGLLSPWTMWLLRRAPEVLGLTYEETVMRTKALLGAEARHRPAGKRV